MKRRKHSALRHGFRDGFSSAFLMFGGRPLKLAYRRQHTAGTAWNRVGEELSAATKTEGDNIEQTARTEERRLVTS